MGTAHGRDASPGPQRPGQDLPQPPPWRQPVSCGFGGFVLVAALAFGPHEAVLGLTPGSVLETRGGAGNENESASCQAKKRFQPWCSVGSSELGSRVPISCLPACRFFSSPEGRSVRPPLSGHGQGCSRPELVPSCPRLATHSTSALRPHPFGAALPFAFRLLVVGQHLAVLREPYGLQLEPSVCVPGNSPQP